MSRMVRVKQREDEIVLSNRGCFHDDDDDELVQVVVMTCLAWLNNYMMHIPLLEPKMI
jgi:hypothetical protein